MPKRKYFPSSDYIIDLDSDIYKRIKQQCNNHDYFYGISDDNTPKSTLAPLVEASSNQYYLPVNSSKLSNISQLIESAFVLPQSQVQHSFISADTDIVYTYRPMLPDTLGKTTEYTD